MQPFCHIAILQQAGLSLHPAPILPENTFLHAEKYMYVFDTSNCAISHNKQGNVDSCKVCHGHHAS